MCEACGSYVESFVLFHQTTERMFCWRGLNPTANIYLNIFKHIFIILFFNVIICNLKYYFNILNILFTFYIFTTTILNIKAQYLVYIHFLSTFDYKYYIKS